MLRTTLRRLLAVMKSAFLQGRVHLVHQGANRGLVCGCRNWRLLGYYLCGSPNLVFRHDRGLELIQERVHRAVDFGLCAHLFYGPFQNAYHAPGFGRADIFAEVMVFEYGNLADIEREHQLVFRDGDGGVWPEGVPDAKFVKRIGVVGGNVGNRQCRLSAAACTSRH